MTGRIYYTTDVHCYLFDTDYIQEGPLNMGLLKVIQNIKKDENSLMIDLGDNLQGSPLAIYANKTNRRPQVKALQCGQYDYMVPGNHDFNFGIDTLASYLKEAGIPVLMSNIEDTQGRLHTRPYAIHTFPSGLKIGMVGLVTDYVQVWESKKSMEGLQFHDAFETAKTMYEKIKDQCDITVLLYHGGFESDIKTGELLSENKENVGYRIAKELDYDVMLTGHQHMDIPFTNLFGTYVMQLPSAAAKYGVIDFDKDDTGITITGQSIVPTAEVDPVCRKEILTIQKETESWLSAFVCTLKEPICPQSKIESAIKGSRFADLINHIQLQYAHSDISCTSLGNRLEHLEGPISIRDVIAAYPFPNTLKIMEVNETILKTVLERCADYFDLSDGKPVVSQRFLNPKVEHYNYDFFLGLDYVIDIRKPLGSRVSHIMFEGKPLGGRTLKLCLNDYRASGTGGYDIYKHCPVIKTFKEDLQELIISYLINNPTLPPWEKSGLQVIW